jgi:L-malate glycosyltransferase
MNILHCVESYYPALGGMQEVVKQLSERLAAAGHQVAVATRKHKDRTHKIVNGVTIIDFNISGNAVNGIEGEKENYERFLLESNFDIVTFFAAQQWATDVALPILDRIHGKKVSVPTGYSGFYWPAYKDYFSKMKNWIHGYDMNVYLSNDYRDINFARANNVSKLCIIPNGASADEFLKENTINIRKELGLSETEYIVLHVGSYTGWKGHHEAMEIFLRSHLKNATLLMIGNNHENFGISKKTHATLYVLKLLNRLFNRKRIIFKYFSREFTVAAYKQADVFLFPSNIECSPIVLFECAAAALPFIATDVGNSVEIAGWTGGGIIAPTKKNPEGFSFINIREGVKILNRFFKDRSIGKQLGKRAFKVWGEKYSWEKITMQYEEMYLNLIGDK